MKAIIITSILILLLTPAAAHAQGPTATPTLPPVQPSPTSAYLYLRPTPTIMIIHPEDVNFHVVTDAGQIADLAINIYRTFNQRNIIDFALFIIMVVVTIVYMARLTGRGVPAAESYKMNNDVGEVLDNMRRIDMAEIEANMKRIAGKE